MTTEKRAEFLTLFSEFAFSYLGNRKGEEHLAEYQRVMEEGRNNYHHVLQAADSGEEITDLVLEKLLPYGYSHRNRERKVWIHSAPAITKDLRAWFENANWTKPDDWPDIARAILRFVQRCATNPAELDAACLEFSTLPYSKGFQTGMLTPILNAIRPDEFMLVNSKSRTIVNYFADTEFEAKLTEYPAINRIALTLIENLADDMLRIAGKVRANAHLFFDITPAILFDLFGHWLIGERKFFKESVIIGQAEMLLESSKKNVTEKPDLVRTAKELVDGSAAITENDSTVTEPIKNTEWSLDDCANESGMPRETIERWVRAINRKGQAILYGPPGTGKTHLAYRLAWHLASGGYGIIENVQFHPEYTYQDFVQGLRPAAQPDGGLDYRMEPGRFLEFCAGAKHRNGISVLIIDEINRANLARVFGEVMTLLEYRDSEIPLAGGGRFQIPTNVRIIGTMNTADRSIALVDHALRRRFAFLELRPQYDVLAAHLVKHPGVDADGLIALLREVNEAINDKHYEVGISFFMRDPAFGDLTPHLEDIWRMEIEPYLEEYFFDRSEDIDAFRWERIAQRVIR